MSNPTYGIVCAMREEVEKINEALSLKKVYTLYGFNVYTGSNVMLIESN